MKVRNIRGLGAAVAGCAAVAAAVIPLAPASAAPATQAVPAAGGGAQAATGGAITMVNGAGRTITIPKSVASGLQGASAGSSGRATGKVAANRIDKLTSTPGGGAQGNTVLGPDGRTQEYAPSSYPWGAIPYLDMGSKGQCTGFMLSRDVVVTAGHCVYNGGWATYYRAVPGKNGASEPFGSCTGGIADVWTTYNYIVTGSSDYDYGLIKLTCNIGNSTGWFGWWYNTGENLVNQYFYVEGFPGDHPAQMWWDGDYTTQQSATRLFYWIDTAPGESGSPVYHYNSVSPGLCGGWCVTGIHTNGPFDSPYNSGTRFTPDVMSFINYWISQP